MCDETNLVWCFWHVFMEIIGHFAIILVSFLTFTSWSVQDEFDDLEDLLMIYGED